MAPQASEKMEFATGNGARTSEGFRGSGSGQPEAAFFWHPPNAGDRGGRREADPGRQKRSDSLGAGFCLQPYLQFPLATAAVLAARESLAIGP
jgi:hypothetical protein